MLLEFNRKEINEFSEGNFHRTNNGKPFEVDNNLGQELLKAKTKIGTGLELETAEVFREAKPVKKSLLTADFPMRAELEANEIYTLEEVRLLEPDAYKRLTGIGQKSFQKITDFVANIPTETPSAEPIVSDVQIVEKAGVVEFVEEEVEIEEK